MMRVYAGAGVILNGPILIFNYDPYYHIRRIVFTVHNFPRVLWFDSYLDYPQGMELTWPPFFDQLAAALALIVGAESQRGIEMATALLPPLLGAATVLVVYVMVREVQDERAGALAALLTAISPYFLLYTSFGESDHHSLEALLMSGVVALQAVALSRKRPGWFIAAGALMALIAYTWLGAAIYFGIILLYAVVQIALDLRAGRSSREFLRSMLLALGTALVLMLPFSNQAWMWPSFASLLTYAGVLLFTYALSLALRGRAPWYALPLSLAALAAGSFLLAVLLDRQMGVLGGAHRLALSTLEYLFVGQMVGRIAEAQPLIGYISLASFLGATLLLFILGVLAMLRAMAQRGASRGQILFLMWMVSTLILTLGQARFLYLLSVSTAVMTAVLFCAAARGLRSRMGRPAPAVAVSLILLALLVVPQALLAISAPELQPPIAGDWYDSLVWLKANTPRTSFYDDPAMRPEYGIMSWWDFGNWILYVSERPVVANNFQTGVMDADRFFLSNSEADASAVMDARMARYVITDWELIYKKFPALANWLEIDPDDYIGYQSTDYFTKVVIKDPMKNTTLAQLHLYDCIGMGRYRLIYESGTYLGEEPPSSRVKIFEYLPGAVIEGTTSSTEPVEAFLAMESNQGRAFYYYNYGVPVDGWYQIQVPYSTQARYDTRATGSYQVISNGRVQKINVSEEDVLKGNSVILHF
ncbi:MAG: peptide transporter [Methanosarcinales archaeon]|nr:peptide transporter [Methanosarcinales archaeon]